MNPGLALLLAAYLLGWIPLTFAIELFNTVPSLDMRGLPGVLELAFHGLVSITAATAGWMLRAGAPAALPAAAIAVVASGAMGLQSLFWTILPRSVAPGQRCPLAVLVCAHSLFWLVLIRRAAR